MLTRYYVIGPYGPARDTFGHYLSFATHEAAEETARVLTTPKNAYVVAIRIGRDFVTGEDAA